MTLDRCLYGLLSVFVLLAVAASVWLMTFDHSVMAKPQKPVCYLSK